MEALGTNILCGYLKKIVRVLELKSSTHNYQQMASTNFGLFTQLVFNMSERDLNGLLKEWPYNEYRHYSYNTIDEDDEKLGIWWKENIKIFWPISGEPTDIRGLFPKLSSHGLTRNRILEIEYLENPVVNEALKDYDWGTIEKPIFEEKTETKLIPIMVTNVTERWVDDKSIWGRIFGRHKKLIEKSELFTGEHELKENIVKVKVGTEIVPASKDFKNPKHVLVYYKKWVELIEKKETWE